MKAVILAAGYGTRLYPYTKHFPKPLLLLKQKPVIDYIIEKIDGINGISEIIVVTNARFFKHFKSWKENSRFKSQITLVNDLSSSPADKLGAVADMYLGIKKGGFKQDYLIAGGDNFLEEPLEGFIKFARCKRPYASIGLTDVGDRKQARHYGVAFLNRKKMISEFQEKPRRPKSTLAAMCLYYFPRAKLGLIKQSISGGKVSFDNIGAYIAWLRENDKVFGFVFKKMWFDIGRIETYRKINKILSLRR